MTGTTSVAGRIYEHLRGAILAGEYDSLPSERRLSDELGASRHAVREALKRLQQSGLIRIATAARPGCGTGAGTAGWSCCSSWAPPTICRPVSSIERPIIEMRASVGADAARRCATRASAVVRAELEARAEMLAAETGLEPATRSTRRSGT